ncbi:MAG TPA: endonuclease V [Syntrophorhabdales bacterium]|nr:endonuclease V [Syntrophorhabdales bacterium]
MRITAGIDASYGVNRYASALATFHDGKLKSVKTDEGELSAPYVSKLFFLREAPALSRLLSGEAIDLLFVNGHGVCHPYFFGLATVIGWTHNIPTIGIASRLIRGEYTRLPSRYPDIEFIMLRCQAVGAAVRLKHFSRPMFVSPGFGVTLGEAIQEYAYWARLGKLPEPLRLAHVQARSLLRNRRRSLEMKP